MTPPDRSSALWDKYLPFTRADLYKLDEGEAEALAQAKVAKDLKDYTPPQVRPHLMDGVRRER